MVEAVNASIAAASHQPSAATSRRLFASVAHGLNVAIVAALAVVMATGAAAVFWFHLAVHPVLTGSMRPTFGPGWVVITRPIPVSHVKVGEILLFKPPGSNASFTHRVIRVEGTPNHPIIMTKGDANPVADPWKAQLKGSTAYQVVGEAPKLGWLLAGGAQLWIRALLVGIGGLLLTVGGAQSILRGSPRRGSSPRRSPARRYVPSHRASSNHRKHAGNFPAPA